MAETQEQWKLSSAHGSSRGLAPERGLWGDPDCGREPWQHRQSCRTCGASSSWWRCFVFNPAFPSACLSEEGLPSPPSFCVQKSSFSSFHAPSLGAFLTPRIASSSFAPSQCSLGTGWHCFALGKSRLQCNLATAVCRACLGRRGMPEMGHTLK